jgi:transcriptional regulator with XRE-family HTH domain
MRWDDRARDAPIHRHARARHAARPARARRPGERSASADTEFIPIDLKIIPIVCSVRDMPEPLDPRLHALGRALRRLRREHDLSQEDLGLRAGLHPNHIGQLERGTRDLRVTTLLNLLNALEATPAELGLSELSDKPTAPRTTTRPRPAARANSDLVQRIDDAQRLLRDIRSAVETGSIS